MPEFPSDQDAATKNDKPMMIGLVLAGIVAVLIIAGSVYNQTSQDHQVNQPGTQSLTDDNTAAHKVQE